MDSGDAMQARIQGYGMRPTIKTDAAKCNPKLSQELASTIDINLYVFQVSCRPTQSQKVFHNKKMTPAELVGHGLSRGTATRVAIGECGDKLEKSHWGRKV
jgi:hypothetical protein